MSEQESRAREMYAYYEEGHSLEECGAKFNYAAQSIFYLFKKYELPRRDGRRKPVDNYDETMSMWNEYQAGASLREISERYYMTAPTVLARFNKYGLETRPRGDRSDLRKTG